MTTLRPVCLRGRSPDKRSAKILGLLPIPVENDVAVAGTTDYAVAAFYGAARTGSYTRYLRPGTYLPMLYMPDAILGLMKVAEADIADLKHHADFNINSMSFAPGEWAEEIGKRVPGFTFDYEIYPLRQSIADSWPNSLDNSAAREEWGWQPDVGIEAMVDDMLYNLSSKLGPPP